MTVRYTSGKYAIAECDRCGQRYKLRELKKLVIKTKQISLKVCGECWEADHPQLHLGMYPVIDPQAVIEPRADTSYSSSGDNNIGSRIFQWGWNPVGGSTVDFTQNDLVIKTVVGTVTVATN
jgi:hypothetical protein